MGGHSVVGYLCVSWTAVRCVGRLLVHGNYFCDMVGRQDIFGSSVILVGQQVRGICVLIPISVLLWVCHHAVGFADLYFLSPES